MSAGNVFPGLLVEQVLPVLASQPVNKTGAAMTAQWVNLALYEGCQCIIVTGAWAGGTAAVTASQAKTLTGGSSKALTFGGSTTTTGIPFYWSNTMASDVITRTAMVSDTFNVSAANTLYLVEVHAASLDLANGFQYFSLAIASPGANADLYAVIYNLYGTSYAQGILPSSMV